MENASKALLMAAGVLMGVLILSLAVYLFANFRATADEATKLMYEEELAQFNNFYLQTNNIIAFNFVFFQCLEFFHKKGFQISKFWKIII